jgi:hypothetical protein
MASILPTGGTCEKYERVFVLHPVTNKNLSRFFKIRFRFPGILLWKKLFNNGKNGGFEFLGEGVFWGKVVFRTPPEVVSGIGRGGGGGCIVFICFTCLHLFVFYFFFYFICFILIIFCLIFITYVLYVVNYICFLILIVFYMLFYFLFSLLCFIVNIIILFLFFD